MPQEITLQMPESLPEAGKEKIKLEEPQIFRSRILSSKPAKDEAMKNLKNLSELTGKEYNF